MALACQYAIVWQMYAKVFVSLTYSKVLDKDVRKNITLYGLKRFPDFPAVTVNFT